MKKIFDADFIPIVLLLGVAAYFVFSKKPEVKKVAGTSAKEEVINATGRYNRGLPAWAGGWSEWGTPPVQQLWDRNDEWMGGRLN